MMPLARFVTGIEIISGFDCLTDFASAADMKPHMWLMSTLPARRSESRAEASGVISITTPSRYGSPLT